MKTFLKDKVLRDKLFFQLLEKNNLPIPTPEYKFHSTRRWRFDYAFPEHKVALELEGGVWIQGRHTRPTGYKNDMEKYTEANLLGWKIIRIEPDEILKHATFELLKRALVA